MTFRKWLMQQTQREDPVGDLARDIAADTEAHRGVVGQSGAVGD